MKLWLPSGMPDIGASLKRIAEDDKGHRKRENNGLSKICREGNTNGLRKRGKPKQRWRDNIKEWTGLNFDTSQRAVEDRNRWRQIVKMSSVVPDDQAG